jgi:hypothetical protein
MKYSTGTNSHGLMRGGAGAGWSGSGALPTSSVTADAACAVVDVVEVLKRTFSSR